MTESRRSFVPPIADTASIEASAIRRDFMQHLFCGQGKFPEVATKNAYYLALAMSA